jgi:hypothetical protein
VRLLRRRLALCRHGGEYRDHPLAAIPGW